MNDSFRPLRRWSDKLFRILFVDALASLWVMITTYEVYHHLLEILQRNAPADGAILTQQEKLAAQIICLLLLSVLVFVLYLIWLHRLATNTNLFSRKKQRPTPGVLIGLHLIPVVYLIVPLWGMMQIWKATTYSAGNVQKVSPLVLFWWILGLATFFSRTRLAGNFGSSTE